jgi:hypothetical protein
MNTRVETYKGHQLIARQGPVGWQVQIGSTGFKSSLHADLKGAFDEARKWIDVQRGRRQ